MRVVILFQIFSSFSTYILLSLLSIFQCRNTPEKPLEVLHFDCTIPMELEFEEGTIYHGPPVKSLDETVQKEYMLLFFDGEPLDSSIMSVIWVLMTNSYPFVCYCLFLIKSLVRDFAIDKEYMEYVNWLKKIVVDPETEEVDH